MHTFIHKYEQREREAGRERLRERDTERKIEREKERKRETERASEMETKREIELHVRLVWNLMRIHLAEPYMWLLALALTAFFWDWVEAIPVHVLVHCNMSLLSVTR